MTLAKRAFRRFNHDEPGFESEINALEGALLSHFPRKCPLLLNVSQQLRLAMRKMEAAASGQRDNRVDAFLERACGACRVIVFGAMLITNKNETSLNIVPP